MARNALFLLFFLSAAAAPPPKLRLPGDVRPLAYALEMRIVPGQDDFSGRVTIDIEALRETPVVWLHAKELKFTAVSAGGAPARSEPAENDFAAITPARPLAAGRTTLTIEYTGQLSRTLTDGIFHQAHNGDWYIFTKFEPVTARRAFPCFDEPGFKTPWQLTLRVPANLKAFSNTPADRETAEPDGSKTIRFARTRPLPSYLVALAVGPFDVVDLAPIGRKRVPGHIIVPRGRAAEASYAAEVTPKAVALLEDYFGIPYPYEKLDQVVVPLTTSWGAIENAGLIAYGQFLLAKPAEDTVPRQRSRLSTMVHEISHQWVGDLVTTAWWDDIWLNEGFASWIALKILDRWRPEWKYRASASGGASSAMTADALVSARKVRQPIELPGDIANAFDGITYVKGAALLRMFENWLGEETFRKGVRQYLARHAWGSATTADLLAALDKAAGRDVSSAFSSFLDQRGVPLVTADVRCDGARAVVRLAQQRFVPIGSSGETAGLWKLPVCFRWSDGASERRDCVLLAGPAAEVPIRGCPAWFLANDNAAGYYRSTYEGDGFDRLLERGLDKLALHEKAALLHNVQALAGGGKFDARQALSLATRFSGSGERDIVVASLRIAGSIAQAVPDELEPTYARFLLGWLGPRARQLGWAPKPGESVDLKQIRLAIVPLVAIGGQDPELGAEASRLAQVWLKDRKAIDRDAAGHILVAAARRGDRVFFEQLVAEIRKTKDQAERLSLIFALAAFRDPEIMRSALDLVLNGGPGLEPREMHGVITSQWKETRATVWEYVQQNFNALNARLPGARGIPYGATLPFAAGGFCDETRAAEVERFFKPRIASLSGGARNLAGVLENIRLCRARRQALEPGVREFLKSSGHARASELGGRSVSPISLAPQ